MKKMSLIIAVAILMIAVYAIGTAVAETLKVTVVVKPGALTLVPSTDSTLLDATLTGDDVVTTGLLNQLEVKEARGNDAGWNLNVLATDFEEINDPSKTIAAGGFTVTNVIGVEFTGGGTVNTSVGSLAGPAGLGMLDAPNGDSYRGRYQATADLQLTVPAATYVGTYASTVTETLTSN